VNRARSVQSKATALCRAAVKAGQKIAHVQIDPDGKITVFCGDAETPSPTSGEGDAFGAWEAKRNARRA